MKLKKVSIVLKKNVISYYYIIPLLGILNFFY